MRKSPKIIRLPRGATRVDLAYAVHTDIGPGFRIAGVVARRLLAREDVAAANDKRPASLVIRGTEGMAGQVCAVLPDDSGRYDHRIDLERQGTAHPHQRSPGHPPDSSGGTCQVSLLQNSPTRFTAPHSIRPLRAICVVREVSIAERLSLWHGFRRLRRTTACIPRMHGGGRGNAGGHSRHRINWSADRARIPNIKCAITLVTPLTIKVLPPNSSLSRALLRSAAVRSL